MLSLPCPCRACTVASVRVHERLVPFISGCTNCRHYLNCAWNGSALVGQTTPNNTQRRIYEKLEFSLGN